MSNTADRLISIREVTHTVGICKAQVYKLVNMGKFPRQIVIGSRCSRWSEMEVQSWIDKQKMNSQTH